MTEMKRVADIDFSATDNKFLLPVNSSNRHLHLSQEDLETLFGAGYELTNIKDLTQPGQFACKETVQVVGVKGLIEMRVLGPVRKETQVELAQTDARKIGIKAPVRESGDLDGTPGAVLVGPKGAVIMKKGCIVAAPHVHLHTSQGKELGLADKDRVDLYIQGEHKAMILQDVVVRVGDNYEMDIHLDTDEANAARVPSGGKALLVKVEK